ncbi:E3 ubiquitin-protein ligase MBR2 isoform X2 [Humulus lupulus]|uniref:E3 ubiquitin-protein ligase MBR2 isoform X2 n=1 Tax=Humulus lupulus TaxID=3486 RepID=UPI002B416115|nr:E3 ubiquitin-protein ligase MBR2 isoform X2 [Humulus lupulus]
MQGTGRSINLFPESVDIVGQGSDSHSGMNQQTSSNTMVPPVESRWSSYATPGELFVNAGNNEVQNFASTSEPTGSGFRNQINDDGIKIEHGRSSYGAQLTVGSMSDEVLFPETSVISLGSNQVRNGHSFLQGSSSSHIHQNMNLNAGFVSNSGNGDQGFEASLGSNLYLSSRMETEQTSSATVSSDIGGTSSGSSGGIVGKSDSSSGTLGNWGLSCKRKALEGTSGQSCSGGSSSSFPQAENSAWQTGAARYNPSSSLRLSAPSCTFPSGSTSDQSDSRTVVTTGTVASDSFPSSNITENPEASRRHFGGESNARSRRESLLFNLASAENSRRSFLRFPHQAPSSAPFSVPLDLRSTAAAINSGASQNQSHTVHVPVLAGSTHAFLWNGASNSRAGSMPTSLALGERGTEVREESNVINMPRTNVEHPMFPSANEIRNLAHDPMLSSLASGNISTSLGIPSSTRMVSSSSSPPLSSSSSPLSTPGWIPHHNPPTQSRQRTLEFAPWSLFPSGDSQPGGRSGHSIPSPPGPSSSSQDTIMSSGRNNQNRHQSLLRSAFMGDRQGEDVLNISNSLRVLSADIEGRRRLISEIRQVLHAMRRGENLQVEDYMLFDPFVYHGMAEMHDRHRDMRLDVDNMSYEELLALEERIGDVSTGLSEEMVLKLMKQRKYEPISVEVGPDPEPCCICQEEYADGDDVGALDCGHDFHTDCVKQWLMQKNLCPICKTTGLLT